MRFQTSEFLFGSCVLSRPTDVPSTDVLPPAIPYSMDPSAHSVESRRKLCIIFLMGWCTDTRLIVEHYSYSWAWSSKLLRDGRPSESGLAITMENSPEGIAFGIHSFSASTLNKWKQCIHMKIDIYVNLCGYLYRCCWRQFFGRLGLMTTWLLRLRGMPLVLCSHGWFLSSLHRFGVMNTVIHSPCTRKGC